MLTACIRIFRAVLDRILGWISGVGAAVVSNRCLALIVLAGCVVLILGPWLRPPISRDFRGPHIPWGEIASPSFLPELATEVPRPWRWNSIAAPLLATVALGAVAILAWPRVMGTVFGLLLALSMPAAAVAVWNYPALIDSFESETRDRTFLRAVFRQQSEHMLSAGTPDRLAQLGDKSSREEMLLERVHALAQPWRYLTYGWYLIGVALVMALVTHRGTWLTRIKRTSVWIAVGLLLAVAATWPRWLAEYHWAQAEVLENANRFAAASQSLESVRRAMPAMAKTRQYWLAKGRLSFRQRQPDNEFQAFFLAHQAVLSGDFDRARAVLERYVHGSQGTAAERDLLSGILAYRAAEYVSESKYSAAELCWREAAAMAPWKVGYWIAQCAAQLAVAPHRAHEIEQQAVPRLRQVADRMVTSDFHSIVGDAYFVVGDFTRARAMYDRAIELFHLPKYINVHAQEGRLGL